MPLAQGACRVGGKESITLPLRELFEEPALMGVAGDAQSMKQGAEA